MNPERWNEVKAVFQDALDVATPERAGFLDRVCEGDTSLRGEVESLLRAYDGADGFLDADESDDPVDSSTAQTLLVRLCPGCGARFAGSEIICPQDGEVLEEDPYALVGATLDGLYHVERLLGRGGFGTVYLARHELLQDRVAVKVLRREVSANPELLRRFLREGRAARSIQHPNVVAIHDLRTTPEGLAFMVLEYVEGETLRHALKQVGRFGVEEALDILEPLALALDAAHEAGIVHRDVKPENVMIGGTDRSRTVKLLDLGLARLREMAGGGSLVASALSVAGQFIGSPSYMSPEQWGEPQRDGEAETDARSDVYSLGVVAYELVTGQRPFSGETLSDLRRAHTSVEPPLAHERVLGVPSRFGLAVARALSKDRGDRQVSAGAFVRELREGVDAPVELSRARPVRAGVAALAGLALAAAPIWWLLDPGEAQPVREGGDVVAPAPAITKPYARMSETERVAFVDERARAVSRLMAGREYTFPPDARSNIKRQVDRYAARVGTGNQRFGSEDLRLVFDRGRRYAPRLASTFGEFGITPVIGLYLPMIESEFVSTATSAMGARGMFQMLPQTAKNLYGFDPDDLYDVEKSAPIAARYIRDQMTQFAGDRMSAALSVAAYNRGPTGIQEYLDGVVAFDDREADLRFWAFIGNSNSQHSRSDETTHYVARFFAAAIVGETPRAFGLEMEPFTSYADVRGFRAD